MRLVSFLIGGKRHFGVVQGDGVIDLTARLGCTINEFIAAASAGPVALPDSGASDHTLSGLEFLPVVPNPGKIICRW